MKRKKRIHLILALLLSCVLVLSGCGGQNDVPSGAENQAAPSAAEDSENSAPDTSEDETQLSEEDPDPENDADSDTGSDEERPVTRSKKISFSGTGSTGENAGSTPSKANSSGRTDSKTPASQNRNPAIPGTALTVSPGGSGKPGGASASTGSKPSGSSSKPSAPSKAGSLQVRGTQLCDSAGNPVQLRGISTHGLAWFPDYVNEQCFADFRQNWNANVVRLAMYTAEYGGYCSGGNTSQLKNLVKNGIRYAASQDLYVIVDWHILSDNNPNSHVSEAKSFFDEISSEFSSSTHILYEICNEPNGGTSWSDIKSYALQVIPVIRANDPDAVIIVGTPNWSQYVDQAAADPITEYDNLMYALHFYAATHKDDLRSKMTSAISKGLPIFVTEYGICDASGNGGLDIDQANQWVSTMDQYGVSYVAWNLSNKSESSAILRSSCSKTSGFGQEDLSDSGKWLYEMLTGHTAAPAPATPAPATPPSEPAPSAPAPAPQPAAPTPAPEPAAPAPETNTGQTMTNDNGIQVAATIINNWENDGIPYYQYTLTLTNTTGANCSSWTIHLPCEGSMSLSDSWNGEYSISGGQLVISAKDYNGSIPAGGSIDNIGFIVSGGKLQ